MLQFYRMKSSCNCIPENFSKLVVDPGKYNYRVVKHEGKKRNISRIKASNNRL